MRYIHLEVSGPEYVDRHMRMLVKTFHKRMRGCRAMGYSVADCEPPESPDDDHVIEYDSGGPRRARRV